MRCRKVETTKARMEKLKIKAAVIIREKKIIFQKVLKHLKSYDEKLLEIKSLVQEALGYDEARGDSSYK